MAQRQIRSDDTSQWLEGYGNGSDGVKTVAGNETYDGARASCSGTSTTNTLSLGSASTFSDGDLVLIHQSRGTGAGNWEVNKINSGGGTTTLTLKYALINTYTDSGSSQAQVVEMKQYSTVTVNSGISFSAPAWDGDTGGIIAFFCNGTVTVTGSINANSAGYRGGTGGSSNVSSDPQSISGEGTVGPGLQGFSNSSFAANGNGGGAGVDGSGPLNPGSGAGGGHATSGNNGQSRSGSTAGNGGVSAGSADLVTMVFGGGGGGGDGVSGNASGNGGNGGGISFVVGKTITLTGSVVSNGANGGENYAGGGAGGSLLFKGQVIDLGTNLVTVNGTNAGSSNSGGQGSVGRIHVDYLTSFTGSATPTIDSRQDSSLVDAIIASTGYAFFM